MQLRYAYRLDPTPGQGQALARAFGLPNEPSSVTVTVDAAGRYHASFIVEVPDAPLPAVDREVGIDLGLTHFAVLSDGRKVDNPRIARKAAAKLRRAQGGPARPHVHQGGPLVPVHPGRARRAGPSAKPSPCASASGPAPAGRPTTGT